MTGRYGSFQLIESLEKYLSHEELSGNLDFPLTFILTHKEWKWDWKKVTNRGDVKPDIILENIRLNWDLKGVCGKDDSLITSILEGNFNFRFLATEEEMKENGWDVWDDRELYDGDYFLYASNRSKILEEYSNFPWNFYNISKSKYFKLENAIKFQDKNLDWEKVYENNVRYNNIKKCWGIIPKVLPYMSDYEVTEYFKNIDFEKPHSLVEKFFDFLFEKVDRDIFYKRIPLEYISLYPNKKWRWGLFLIRENLTLDFILLHFDKLDVESMKVGDKWIYLESHKSLPFSYITEHTELKWRWGVVSRREDIDLNYLHLNIHMKKWNMDELSKNPSIPFSFAVKHLNRGWEWSSFYEKPEFKLEFIENYPDLDWPWNRISRRDDLTLEFIEKFRTKPWAWDAISRNGKLFLGATDGYIKKAKREEE